MQESILNRFRVLVRNNRLAHAYLFIGPKDVGKAQTAIAIAKLVNCEHPSSGLSCNACAVCLKIEHGNHPDIHVISADETQTIKIEQIRHLIERIQLRPFEGKKKVFIIKNIEHLTPEGGNALLKTLEEPVKDSLLILTTAVPEENLDTIKSRCHGVSFFPSSNRKLELHLTKDYAIDQIKSHFLAYYAEGCPGLARRFEEDEIFERKNEAINKIVCAAESDDYLKKILADKIKTKEILNVLLSWFRDLLLLKTGVDESRLVHLDRIKELKKYEQSYSFVQLTEMINEITGTARLLGENLNVKLGVSLIKEKLWRRT